MCLHAPSSICMLLLLIYLHYNVFTYPLFPLFIILLLLIFLHYNVFTYPLFPLYVVVIDLSVSQCVNIPPLPSVTHRFVGLVVKASTSRAEGPGFESRLRRDFFGVESYQ